MPFSALKYVDKLVEAGVPEKQAKAQVLILQDFKDSEIATKRDLKLAVKELDTKMEIKLKELDTRMETKLKELEYKITLSRYITILAIPAILVALKKLGIM